MLNTEYDEYLIGDVNPDLIALYKEIATILDLIERARHLFETFNSSDGFYDSRYSFNHDADSEWRSALFLYLNRHCFNGVCRYNRVVISMCHTANISVRIFLSEIKVLQKRRAGQRLFVPAMCTRWKWWLRAMLFIAIRHI
jgi:hypothetical protein